ncbi:PilW family protein [Endozoicomonas sp. 8E]|uniref:PilW family protein n=1 Tax=Endozoicomonas sp. 8E TaxID=3035692 RepID=UPI0029393721|nr:PilW family protein [Endozoicomonas sp. 8E]WOG26410.1 PilW family protein [Endozoicomonas sp. 8E]
MNSSKQKGLSLIELMISMLLGIFIIASVTQVFLSSNNSNRLNFQLGLMQEAARIAVSAMSNDVRVAGYTGCNTKVSIGNALLQNSATHEWLTAEQPIQGMNLSDTQSKMDAQATSESLLVFKVNPDTVFSITNHDTSTSTLTLDRNIGSTLPTGGAAAITRQDCSQVALIALSSISGSNLTHTTSGAGDFRNCVAQLKGSFRCYDGSTPSGALSFNPGYLKPLGSVGYFVKPDNGLPTLFRKEAGNPTAIAIVDGIEDIRIHYGLDTDNDGVTNRYIRAGDRSFRHADWLQTTAIRIHLLTRSETEILPVPAPLPAPPRTYLFDGQQVAQSDRFLRKEYVMTMALRNRG